MYEVVFRRKAEKSLARLSDNTYHRIVRAIDRLADDPRPPGCTSLKGREEWRVRVGDYRIVYAIDDGQHLVEILSIGHRRDIYRRG